jgi:hypothetical protein
MRISRADRRFHGAATILILPKSKSATLHRRTYMANTTEFVVKLEDFKLSAAQKKSLGQAINAAVDNELVGQGLTVGGTIHRIPPDWLGKYLRQLGNVELNKINEGRQF